MVTNIVDTQLVGETEGTIFAMLQPYTVESLVILTNAGANTMNYRFQQFDGSTWTNLDSSGTDLYNTLTSGQTRSVKVAATVSGMQVRMLGNASGGTTLSFGVSRYVSRSAGGSLPVLSY